MFSSLLNFFSGDTDKWPKLTMEEVSEHNTSGTCYIVKGTKIYDVTSILEEHPGGSHALLKRGGGVTDCTRDYHFHSKDGRAAWAQHRVATLVTDPTEATSYEQHQKNVRQQQQTGKALQGGEAAKASAAAAVAMVDMKTTTSSSSNNNGATTTASAAQTGTVAQGAPTTSPTTTPKSSSTPMFSSGNSDEISLAKKPNISRKPVGSESESKFLFSPVPSESHAPDWEPEHPKQLPPANRSSQSMASNRKEDQPNVLVNVGKEKQK